MLNIITARALSSWMLFDLVSAQFQGPLTTAGQTFPGQFSQPDGSSGDYGPQPNGPPFHDQQFPTGRFPGGAPNGFPPNGPQFPPGRFLGGAPNGLSPNGQPFLSTGLPQRPASGLDTTLPYQCDQYGGQEMVLKLKHCNLALEQFFNYGQWVWSTELLSSRTCSTCRVVLESQSVFAVAVPAQALQKKVFDILSGCHNHAGLASLNQGVALPFGSFGPVTVTLQIAQGKKCAASRADDDDGDDDDSDENDDDASTSTKSASGRSTSSSPVADRSTTSSRPGAGRTTTSTSGTSTTAGGARSSTT